MNDKSRGILISIAAAALIAVGLGCQAGRSYGEACAETVDCREGLICLGEECIRPGTCPSKAPVSCGDGSCCPQAFNVCCGDGNCYGSQAECRAATCKETGQTCRQTSDCCGALTCQAGVCKTSTPPTCAGRSCTTSASCCNGYTCSRYGKTCRAARDLAIGEPCTADAQCSSGICSGYCTDFCTRREDCGGANYCLSTVSGFLCIPFCQDSSDCTVFGIGTTACQVGTDPAGLSLKGCFGR